MTARVGMINLIHQLRALTNAGLSDYSVGGLSYFSDDQLQEELDARQALYREVPLEAVPQRVGSSYVYKDFALPAYVLLALEEEGSGTGGWSVKDINGTAKTITTDYTVNYRAGLITFVADQVASPSFTLDCRSYDLNAAAAAVWREKAALESRSVDWSNQSESFRASQRRDYCLTMAETFARKAGIRSTPVYRSDEI